ncbi:hypothetical protein [Microterricola pindariensis]|uniref:Pilus assembly protein PilO n=1 Tax=Microterricola pindariensis TaxID=478010 RepID=A0ABX5AYT1_9MICO|nr:hypothetical protein [Microterricola pindariensis]PPL20050.1 hypothetical protein GY24_02800 [Microterricola pindariensis]
MNDKRIWTIGAALLAAAVLLGGYFLGVAPQLTAASAADTERAAVEAQNAALAAELEVLKKDFESIDTFKSELAEVRVSVPDSASFSAFVSELDALAVAAGVQVSTLTVAESRPYAGPVNGSALMLPAGALEELSEKMKTAAATGDAADADAAAALDKALKRPIMAPAESALVTPSNFVAIPVTIEAKGEYQRVLDFTSAVQNASRLTLIYGLSLAPIEAGEGEEAEATVITDITPYTGTMSGYIYVLLKASDVPVDLAAEDAAAAEAEAAAAAEAAPE